MLGIDLFLDACGRAGIRGVPGVEISVDFGPGTLHMLGYYVDGGNEGLKSMLCQLRAGREERNRKILKNLNELGLALFACSPAGMAPTRVGQRLLPAAQKLLVDAQQSRTSPAACWAT
jgi:hypothetical protein